MLLDATVQEHQYTQHRERTATRDLQLNFRMLLDLQNYPNVRLIVQAQDLERLDPENETEEICDGGKIKLP